MRLDAFGDGDDSLGGGIYAFFVLLFRLGNRLDGLGRHLDADFWR